MKNMNKIYGVKKTGYTTVYIHSFIGIYRLHYGIYFIYCVRRNIAIEVYKAFDDFPGAYNDSKITSKKRLYSNFFS